MAKKLRRGQKQCPACNAWVKGTRAKVCPKCGHEFNGKARAVAQVASPVAAPAQKSNGDMVTLDQIRAVNQAIRAVGGAGRLNDLLGLIKEIGGLKKFANLVEAISIPEADESKV